MTRVPSPTWGVSRDQVLAYGVGYGMGSVVSPELSFSFLDCDSFLAQIE